MLDRELGHCQREDRLVRDCSRLVSAADSNGSHCLALSISLLDRELGHCQREDRLVRDCSRLVCVADSNGSHCVAGLSHGCANLEFEPQLPLSNG